MSRTVTRRPSSEPGTFMADVSEQPALAYDRIAQRGVSGGGYDVLFGLILADLTHLARLPAEALAVSTAQQAGTDAAPLPAAATEMDHMAGVPPHPMSADIQGLCEDCLAQNSEP